MRAAGAGLSRIMEVVSFRFQGFPPEARQFLRDLRDNNNREWFKARKADYERHVRQPLLQLVEEIGNSIPRYAPGYLQDPRKSVYRIYRDIRFSRNKQPYKTNAAAIFPPVGLPRHSAAGFYFHFSPEELLIGGGLYAPGSAELRRIRGQIAEDPDQLRAILSDETFARRFSGLEGKRLKGTPRGFRRDHPAADLLAFKQYLSGANFPAAEIEQPSVGDLIDGHFRILAPLLQYLNRPLRLS